MSPELSRPLDVLLIGCGNIAGGFDAARDPQAPPLTHAGAFTRDARFRVQACVDPDHSRREAFMARWSVPLGATRVEELPLAAQHAEIVAICSPTACHEQHLAEALRLRPRLIFCEKPLTPTLASSRHWVQQCAAAGVSLAVNHNRRWAPDVSRLAEDLAAGRWGAVRSATGFYSKGLLNNGGHLLDLLGRLLGPMQVLAAGAPVWDFWPDDPSVPALLRSVAGVPVQLATGHAGDYAIFELSLITEAGVITMEDGGQAWRLRRAAASSSFSGYRSLDAGERIAGQYQLAMACAVDNIALHLLQGEALACDGSHALAAQQLCEALLAMSRTDNPNLFETRNLT